MLNKIHHENFQDIKIRAMLAHQQNILILQIVATCFSIENIFGIHAIASAFSFPQINEGIFLFYIFYLAAQLIQYYV